MPLSIAYLPLFVQKQRTRWRGRQWRYHDNTVAGHVLLSSETNVPDSIITVIGQSQHSTLRNSYLIKRQCTINIQRQHSLSMPEVMYPGNGKYWCGGRGGGWVCNTFGVRVTLKAFCGCLHLFSFSRHNHNPMPNLNHVF